MRLREIRKKRENTTFCLNLIPPKKTCRRKANGISRSPEMRPSAVENREAAKLHVAVRHDRAIIAQIQP